MSSLAALKSIAKQGNGTLVRSHLGNMIRKLFSNIWERNLAYGIAESWLEMGGVPVVDTMSEVSDLVD